MNMTKGYWVNFYVNVLRSFWSS